MGFSISHHDIDDIIVDKAAWYATKNFNKKRVQQRVKRNIWLYDTVKTKYFFWTVWTLIHEIACVTYILFHLMKRSSEGKDVYIFLKIQR